MNNQASYWDSAWKKRIDGDEVSGNQKKFVKIMEYLWAKPQFFNKLKLDVGCGPAHHAIAISRLAKNFKETWTGVDLSEVAVRYARLHNMDAYITDFFELAPERIFEVFFFWDSLEHFEDLRKVAAKVKEIAAEKFTICGNVPLFLTKIEAEGGIENPIDIQVIRSFLHSCGCGDSLWYHVYDTNGYPFLMFEAEGVSA